MAVAEQGRHERGVTVTPTHQSCLLLPDPAWLIHLAGRNTARGVCGIGVVSHFAKVLMAAFCANEYLDFHIEGRIVWLNPFEP